MTHIDPAHEAARENAREGDGTFGHQKHPEPSTVLGMDAIRAAEAAELYSLGKPVIWTDPETGERLQGSVFISDGCTGQPDDELTIELEDGDEVVTTVGAVMTPGQAARSITAKLEAENTRYDIYYVHYDDKMSPESQAAYLSGDMDGLSDMYDAWSESYDDSVTGTVTAILNDEGLSHEYVDEDILRDYVAEHDDSNLLKGLLRQTGPQLMRARLDRLDTSSLFSGHDDAVWDKRIQHIEDRLTAAGMTIGEEERKDISDLVHNGPFDWHEGVRLEVIYQDDLRNSTVWDQTDGGIKERDLEFSDPHILLIDSINGSGYDTQIKGTIKARISEDRPAMLDEKPDFGYSWDDVCGLVKSAYNTDVTSTWVPAPEQEQAA